MAARERGEAEAVAARARAWQWIYRLSIERGGGSKSKSIEHEIINKRITFNGTTDLGIYSASLGKL